MSPPRLTRRLAGAALVVAVLAGCGPSSPPDAATELLVTRDYGATSLVQRDEAKPGGSGKPADLLRANAPGVTVRGGRVQSIEGVAAGRGRSWHLYINGVRTDQVPAPGENAVEVHDGDRVWWDLHDGGDLGGAPAVVGSYPEPFVRGIDGRRQPTRVECVTQGPDCQAVQDKLVAFGLPAAKGGIAGSFTRDTLRILVGPWPALRSDVTAAQLEAGPAVSGVFARPAADGQTLALLDAAGRVTRTLGPGSGLIAAVRAGQKDADPVWVVTGTDAAGIALATGALDEGALAGRFAVAIAAGAPIALPDRP